MRELGAIDYHKKRTTVLKSCVTPCNANISIIPRSVHAKSNEKLINARLLTYFQSQLYTYHKRDTVVCIFRIVNIDPRSLSFIFCRDFPAFTSLFICESVGVAFLFFVQTTITTTTTATKKKNNVLSPDN